jgi:hypothetical protein
MEDLLIIISIVLLFFGSIYYFFGESLYPSLIINSIKDGKEETIVTQQQSSQISFIGWIRIDDFDYKQGNERIIFVKGSSDLSLACPSLSIDPHTNTLLVKVDTFDSQHIIPIDNIPTKKWLHFALTVNEHDLKVYINGIEKAYQYLPSLIKTNKSPIVVSPNGGFSGRVVSLKYFNKVLSYDEIQTLSKNIPSTGNETNQIFPPYFDSSWFRS